MALRKKSGPFVRLSYAQSLDGRIACASGDSRGISGPQTLRLAHELRRNCDAILVGIGTVLKDNPRLNCRLRSGCARQPLRVILDGGLRLPAAARVADTSAQRTLVCCRRASLLEAGRSGSLAALTAAGVEAAALSAGRDGRLDLRALLAELGRRGVRNLFVEGGAAVITAFLRAGLVDELLLVTAPLMLGQGVEAVGDLGVRRVAGALRFRSVSSSRLGRDLVWKLEPVRKR